ncbi:L-lactate dehydrogenase (cytochrome) [Exophiala dermatitidis]
MSVREISAEEIGRHNRDDDAWIILNGDVWDISGFADKHPGGPEAVEEFFGRDGSVIYNQLHSPRLAEKFLGLEKKVGVLEQKATDKTARAAAEQEASDEESRPELESIVSIHEFEQIAPKALRPKSWAYIDGATEDGLTKAANADWYRRIWFRPRVLTGVGEADTSTTIYGRKWASPILNSPTSSAMLAHPDGELALARALSSCGNPIIIPTMSSYPLQDIVAALPKDHPFFFQLYVHRDRAEMEKLLDEVVALKPQGILVTVDLPVMSKRESYAKYLAQERLAKKKLTHIPMSEKATVVTIDPKLNWDDIKYIKDRTGLPTFVKGVQCAADARRAYELGCAGIYISNHGGRALDTAPPPILTLLEIQANCPEILDHMHVFVDGGIRRGSDILKAICLGASAVCLGRPVLYSLTYGEQGVKHAIEILQAELDNAMQLNGITSLDQAHPGLLNTTELDQYIYRGDHHPWARKPQRSKL